MDRNQNELAAKFLLGKLTEEEQANIEKDFFQNTSSFENILIAENSLTDAYVSGRLSPEDRFLFERRLLINPRQQQRLAFAETLVRYASSRPIEDLDPSTTGSTWSTAFARLFFVRPLLSYSFAASIVLIAIAAVWLTSTDSRLLTGESLAAANMPAEPEIKGPLSKAQTGDSESAKEVDSSLRGKPDNDDRPAKLGPPLPRTDMPRRRETSTIISTIVLPLGLTRSTESAKVFVVPEKTGLVNLRLKFENADFSSYFVVVETVDGQQVWKGKVIKSRELGNTVTLTVPAKLLSKGDYIIALKGLTKAGAFESVGDYSFTVDRR